MCLKRQWDIPVLRYLKAEQCLSLTPKTFILLNVKKYKENKKQTNRKFSLECVPDSLLASQAQIGCSSAVTRGHSTRIPSVNILLFKYINFNIFLFFFSISWHMKSSFRPNSASWLCIQQVFYTAQKNKNKILVTTGQSCPYASSLHSSWVSGLKSCSDDAVILLVLRKTDLIWKNIMCKDWVVSWWASAVTILARWWILFKWHREVEVLISRCDSKSTV